MVDASYNCPEDVGVVRCRQQQITGCGAISDAGETALLSGLAGHIDVQLYFLTRLKIFANRIPAFDV